MRLFLVRHGETVDNVAGVYAGVTDSALTNHGVLQANRLGQYLADTGVKVSHIFSSDLVRAFKTAEAIRTAQPTHLDEQFSVPREVTKLALLREQDFGSYERKNFYERTRDLNKSGKELHEQNGKSDPAFRDVESREAMIARCHVFIDDNLSQLFNTVPEKHSVVVVAHGIILTHLWRCVLLRFPIPSVLVSPGVPGSDRLMDLMHLGSWSNTGYLELELKASLCEEQTIVLSAASIGVASDPVTSLGTNPNETERPKLLNMSLVVKAVNSLEHLKGLKKTRGGIGSSKHDEGQKTIEAFFKKRKVG